MTNEQIIKALECMAIDRDFDETHCIGCAFENQEICCENCSEGIAKLALDYVTRQKAEIEELQTRIVNWRKDMDYRPDGVKSEVIKEFCEKRENEYVEDDV